MPTDAKYAKLLHKFKRVRAERDALLLALKEARCCEECMHREEKEALNEVYDMPSQCINCRLEKTQFQWRGVCAENEGCETHES